MSALHPATRGHVSCHKPRHVRRFVNVACCMKQDHVGVDAPVQTQCTRRLLLRSTSIPLIIGVLGTDDPTTIVNSVLGAYGLPMLKASSSFRSYDEFDDDFTFQYPRSWVSKPNSLRGGVYISDYQTADKLTVEVFAVPADGDIVHAAIRRAVVPGGAGQEDDKLQLPSERLIKQSTEALDGLEYTYLAFPSETITRSGYQIRRRNFAVAATKRGMVYTIAASARSDQFNKDKEVVLKRIVESFRVR